MRRKESRMNSAEKGWELALLSNRERNARAGKQDDIQIARDRNDSAHGNERAPRGPHKSLAGVVERLCRTCQLRQWADANNLTQNARERHDTNPNQYAPLQSPMHTTNSSCRQRTPLT